MRFRFGGLCLALLCGAAPAVADSGAPATALPAPASGWDTRYWIPAGTDLSALVDDPEIIEARQYLFSEPASGERRIAGYVDLHAVYDLPLSDILPVVLDVEALPDYMPFILEATVTARSADGYTASYLAGISFLGMKVAYRTVAESRVTRFADGSVGIASHLVESVDGNMYEHYTSWYLATVSVGGKPMTYIRYYNRPGIRKPFAGMLSIAKTFTPPNSKGQVTATIKEAKKRAKKS